DSWPGPGLWQSDGLSLLWWDDTVWLDHRLRHGESGIARPWGNLRVSLHWCWNPYCPRRAQRERRCWPHCSRRRHVACVHRNRRVQLGLDQLPKLRVRLLLLGRVLISCMTSASLLLLTGCGSAQDTPEEPSTTTMTHEFSGSPA